nr:hypothetical protein CFP56_46587 [Quercus suber]
MAAEEAGVVPNGKAEEAAVVTEVFIATFDEPAKEADSLGVIETAKGTTDPFGVIETAKGPNEVIRYSPS